VIVLDTNVVSESIRPVPNENVMRWLVEHASELAITAVTVAELSLSLELLPEGQRRTVLRHHLGMVLDNYRDRVLDFDWQAGWCYGEVVAQRRVIGRPITTEDGMIAAICLGQAMPLATRHVKNFAGLGLTLVNPWDGP